MGSDSILALATLVTAFGTVAGVVAGIIRVGRKEKQDSAMNAYAKVMDERQEWAKEIQEDNARLRKENVDLRDEINRLRGGRVS